MKIPVSWLEKYIKLDGLDINQLAHLMTMAGTEVSSVEHIGESWDSEHLVVGEIVVDVAPGKVVVVVVVVVVVDVVVVVAPGGAICAALILAIGLEITIPVLVNGPAHDCPVATR